MVFEVAHDNDIIAVEIGAAPGGGDEVDGFGGAAGENTFCGLAGINESANLFA